MPGCRPIWRPPEATTTKVFDLVTFDGQAWDENSLYANLLPPDMCTMKKIPLGRLDEDMWAWSEEKNGMYSVRSAYQLLSLTNRVFEHLSKKNSWPSFDEANPLWKKLWKMSVPPKVRDFWWRVAHDFVPVRANMHKRHVENHATCLDCGARMRLSSMP